MRFAQPKVVWVLGGWHGVLPFLLLSRRRMPIRHVRSFDIDASCESVADAINENWVKKGWAFKAQTADASGLDYSSPDRPDVVINTSSEHFPDSGWYDRIPDGTLVAIQASDLEHDDHIRRPRDQGDLVRMHPMKVRFLGTIDFEYPGGRFRRFMAIGDKHDGGAADAR
jgi:hypothetical protein